MSTHFLLILAALGLVSACSEPSLHSAPSGPTPGNDGRPDGERDAGPRVTAPIRDFPHELPAAPRPLDVAFPETWTSGHAIAVHAGEVFATDPDAGAVVVLSPASGEVVRTILVGERPEQLVIAPDGMVYVTLRGGAAVVRFAARAPEPDLWAGVGVEPVGLALSIDARSLFVAVRGDDALVVLDPATLEEVERIALRAHPRSVAVAVLGAVVVTHEDGEVSIVHPGTAWPVAALIDVVPLRRQTPVDRTARPARPDPLRANRAFGVTIHPETGAVLVAHQLVATGSADTVLADVRQRIADQVPPSPSQYYGGAPASPPASARDIYGLAVPPVRMELVVTAVGGGETRDTVRPVRDPESGRMLTALVGGPSDIAHHPTDSIALVTAYTHDRVLVLNTADADPMRWPLGVIDVGDGPRGVAFSADGDEAYVVNAHSRDVSIVDLSPFRHPAPAEAADLADPRYAGPLSPVAAVRPLHVRTERSVPLGPDPLASRARAGASLFASASPLVSTSGEVACDNCHIEGGHDGLIWYTLEGPRQTPPLAGRLNGAAPFNLRGTTPDLAGNIALTTIRLGGAGLDQEARVLLAEYLQALPGWPNASQSVSQAARRGRDLFFDPETGCAECHFGEGAADGQQHLVVQLTDYEELMWGLATRLGIVSGDPVFDTPVLRGLHDAAPYLHDGSAVTLWDVLDHTSGRMGRTDHLDEDDRRDLIAWLETL